MKSVQEHQSAELEKLAGLSRRHFFKYAGGLLAVGTFLSACSKSDNNNANPSTGTTIDLGTGDPGILNYAYALEQLEAAFYTQVVKTPYSNMTSSEMTLLSDIRDHEVAHREFFKAALGSSAIIGLTPNFSTIDFSSRASVLGTAKTFEDLGVSAYNGAGHLLASADYLLIAGKIVSVEARHAAYLRDLLTYNSFADNTAVNANGLDLSNPSTTVLTAANQYLMSTSQVSGNNLPH